MSLLDDLASGKAMRGTVKKYCGNHEPKDFLDESFFDLPDDSRWFGFITGDDGQDYFFHFNQGLDLFFNIHLDIMLSTNQKVPEVGDRVVFNTTVGTKSQKLRANHWVFESNLMDVQAAIRKYKKFRIVKKGTTPAKVVWEGAEQMMGTKFREYVTAGLKLGNNTVRGEELLFQRMLDGGEWTLWESHHATFTPTDYVRVVKTTTVKSSGKSIVNVTEVTPKDDYRGIYDLKKNSSDFGTFSIGYHAERMDNQGNWQTTEASMPIAVYAL